MFIVESAVYDMTTFTSQMYVYFYCYARKIYIFFKSFKLIWPDGIFSIQEKHIFNIKQVYNNVLSTV